MNTRAVINKTSSQIWQKWSIAFRIIPLILGLTLLKYLAHRYGYEVMELNALFTTLVAGTIFLIGFLISGVLSDYKESEKIPSELAAFMKSLYDDTYTVFKSKDSVTARRFMEFQQTFVAAITDWFYKKEKTRDLLMKIGQMNDFFADLDKEGIQPNYIIKMKNEQNSIRKLVLRVDTIRDTEFVGSAYAIVEAMGIIIALGLVALRMEPFYASLFFTLLVSALIRYMFLLIKDLDNPFDYAANGERGTEVSLKPVHDLEELLVAVKL